MLGLPWWVSFLVVALAAVTGRTLRLPAGAGRAMHTWLSSRWAAPLAGFLSAAVTVWVWRALDRPPVLHDEAAYLLQAQLFASGRWSGSVTPLPEFFQQLYVLVDPVLASKYPPGHSLILSLGALVGRPALVVVIMNGFAGALVYALARRVAGSPTALLTWLVWMTCFPVLYYRANYMSQTTTSLMWLVAWWGIVRWRDATGGRSWRWLAVGGAAVAWCAITRPMTALALGVVFGVVVLRTARTTRRWREVVPAALVACTVITLLPLWSWRTTGSPTVAPLTVYTRTYVPFDKPGFGVEPGARPSSRLPRDQMITSASFYQEHARHTIGALPHTARERLTMIAHDAWYEWRGGLTVFAMLGMLMLPAEALVVLTAFALQFLLYLSYAHPARWTIYYVEGAPILAFMTAVGVARALAWASRDRSSTEASPWWTPGPLRQWWSWLRRSPAAIEPPHRLMLPICVLIAVGLFAGARVMQQVRGQIDGDHEYHEAFASLLTRISEPRAVVFVRYGPDHNDGLSLVRNAAAPSDARIWTAYDRGADNQRLLRFAPDRAPYLFDETSWTLRRLQRPAESPRTSGVASAPTPDVPTPRR